MADFINAIQNFVSNKIGLLNTFDIGIVDSLNDTNNTLNVTLLRTFQTKYNGYDTTTTIPTVQLYDIPVMRPNCRNFSLVPEYSIGDRVIVGYTKKDVRTQLIADTPQCLDGYDDFNARNAFVLGTIPKIDNFPPTASASDDTTVTLMHKSEATVRFATDGTLTIAQQFPAEFVNCENIQTLDKDKVENKTYAKIQLIPGGKLELSVVNDGGTYTHNDVSGISNLEDTNANALAKITVDNGRAITISYGGSDGSQYGIFMENGNMTIKAKSVNFQKV